MARFMVATPHQAMAAMARAITVRLPKLMASRLASLILVMNWIILRVGLGFKAS